MTEYADDTLDRALDEFLYIVEEDGHCIDEGFWAPYRQRRIKPPKCPYCGKVARFADSIEVYKTVSYGMLWLCAGYPTCDAYVGAHKNSGWPLGRLADAELRKWKRAAHHAFDTRWSMQVDFGGASKTAARTAAYEWLQEKMGLSERECHIGRFDVEQCKRVVELCG